jgi:hypothetical protein
VEVTIMPILGAAAYEFMLFMRLFAADYATFGASMKDFLLLPAVLPKPNSST